MQNCAVHFSNKKKASRKRRKQFIFLTFSVEPNKTHLSHSHPPFMKSPQNIQPSTRFAIRIFSLDRSTTTRASTGSAEIRASTGSAETRASIGSAETRAPTRSAVCCFRRIPVSLPTSLSVSSLWTCGFVASGSGLNFCIV